MKNGFSNRSYRPNNIGMMSEVLSSLIWDTVILGHHDTEITFFQEPLGSTARVCRGEKVELGTKTYSETNMHTVGCDPYKDHAIKYISVDVMPVVKTAVSDHEVEQIKKFGVFDFQIVDKKIVTCPLSLLELPTFEDIIGWMDRAYKYPELLKVYSGDMLKLLNSLIDRDSFSFKEPLIIHQHMMFRSRVFLPVDMNFSTMFVVRVTLHGVMRRPV